MSAGIVPERAVTIGRTAVVSAVPPQGTDWAAAGAAYDLLDGMPSALIPFCNPQILLTAGAAQSLTFTTWPRYQCTHRMWIFCVFVRSGGSVPSSGFGTGGTVGVTGTLTFTDPSGGTSTFRASTAGRLFYHVETVNRAAYATEQDMTCSLLIDNDSGLWGFGCYELPRPSLACAAADLTTSDAGMDSDTLRAGMPITDDATGRGAGFLGLTMTALRDSCRRTGLFAGAPLFSTESGTYTEVFKSPPIVLGRAIYNGDTTRTMEVAFYAMADPGSTGSLKLTMASGATVTVAISATTMTKHRTSIAIDCEDLTAADGRRATRDDTCTVELKVASGAGAVTLYTILGGEGTPAVTELLDDSIRPPKRLPPQYLFGRKRSP